MADDRRTVTFLQAEGLEPLPSQLALKEVSDEFRSILWAYLHDTIKSQKYLDQVEYPWNAILRNWHVRRLFRPVDEFDPRNQVVLKLLKNLVMNWEYAYLFEFLTFVMREKGCPPHIRGLIADAFREARMGYIVEDSTIFPRTSQEEADSIKRAFVALEASEFAGARSHLREAGSLLTAGDTAGSIRESIHAVEGVAKYIEPKGSTLSDTLTKLASASRINPNLKRGLNALYDYASDEKGIRHAKVFEASASVSEAEAIFMLGACASFVSYLIAQSRAV